MTETPLLPPILVVGYGSPIRGDDAVGPIVAERLAEELAGDPSVAVRVCHCLTPELASELAEVRLAIFVDAAVDGPVGEALCRRIAFQPDEPAHATHTFDARQLLALAFQLTGRVPEAYVISTRAASFDLADRRLSPPVAAAVQPMIDAALTLIRS